MLRLKPVQFVLFVCLLAACGGAEETDESVMLAPQPVDGVCQWNFEATIKQGPDAGLALVGNLVLRRTGDTTAEGALLLPPVQGEEIQYVKTSATIASNNDITLIFTLADGRTIQGTGPMGGSFDSCPTPFEGGASGPDPADIGDWGVSCFFCPPPTPTCSAPQIISPFYNGGRIYMNVGSSCIQLGATMQMGPLFQSFTHGPYSMSFDSSGTLFRSTALPADAIPVGTCRGMAVTNPDGVMSAPASLCR